MLPLQIVTISLNGLLAATYAGIAVLLIVGLVQQRGRRFNALGLMLALVTLTSGLSYLAHALIIGLSPWHPGKVTYTILSAVSLVPATIFLLLYRRYEDLLGGVRLLNETRRQLRERSEQLAALVELGAYLTRFHNLDQVLESALARCLALSGFEAGAFYLQPDEQQPLQLQPYPPPPPGMVPCLDLPERIPEGPWQPVSPLHIQTLEKVTAPDQRALGEKGWMDLLDIPIWGARGRFGILRLVSHFPVVLKPDQLNLLEAMGHQIGVVIESVRFLEMQARFHQELQQQVAQATADLRNANESLMAEEQRWHTLIENMPNGLLLLDAENRIAAVNQRAEALFGVSREALMGHTLDDSGLPSELVSALSTVPPTTERCDVVLTAPTACALQVHAAQVIDAAQRYLGRVFVFHDVTREREIDRMKSDFIDLVSHELRTPLTSIIGFVSLMLEGETGQLNEAQRHSLESVRRQARRLASLITDLLDVSRIEAGQVTLQPQPIDLADLAETVLQELQPQAVEKDLTVHFTAPANLPPACGDPQQLARVFTNLLGNAFKFTPPGGEVALTLQVVDGELQGQVRDTGPGIPPEDLPRIFDKFFQGERVATRKSGGTGLGLSIVKGILEAHGGQIAVESVVGQGTTFTFTLPTWSQGAAGEEVSPSPLLSETAPLVLLITSDTAGEGGLIAHLQQRGYRVLTVQEPDQVVVQADAVRPAAILCEESLLPQVVAQLQSDPRTQHIPVRKWGPGEALEEGWAEKGPP
jgi:signal transduction histidine kinase